MNRNISNKTILKIAGSVIGAVIVGGSLKSLMSRNDPYDEDGYDERGFNRDGYDRLGYNSKGYDKSGYNKDGYDKDGYDSSGFDHEGYDRDGYNADGYNRSGLNRSGFDKYGYDKEGFDRFGRDREGYNRHGFARDGFNRDGIDRQGYDRNGYNSYGVDRANFCSEFYSRQIECLNDRLDQASLQMKNEAHRYALYDARVILEEAIRLLVQHFEGNIAISNSILVNLKICENRHLLEDDFIDKLHAVRKICNINGHEFTAEEQFTYDKVYFVIMQVRDLLRIAEEILVPNKPC